MSRSEYDSLDISEEKKEHLQYIDVLVMWSIGYNKTATGKELNKSHAWVSKRYEEIPYLDDSFKMHIKNLNHILSQIAENFAVETDRYYFYENLHEELNRKKPVVSLTCKFESCRRGCIRIMNEVDQKVGWDNQNIFLDRQQEFCNVFRECLGTLQPREIEILDRYYGCSGKSETYSKIAKSRSLSLERIRQIKVKAIRKMRHPSRYKRIMESLTKIYFQ